MSAYQSRTIELTAGIVAAFVEANTVALSDLPNLIRGVHDTLATLGTAPATETPQTEPKPTPAQIRKSITPDALISFIDGRPYKTLKRHVTTHGLTIEEYRAKFGLPADYPTTAPAYSAARSAMAKALGLGQGGRKPKAGRKPAAKA